MNETTVFKCYLRSLIRQLKQLKKALDENKTDEAKILINELITDTQKNIES